MSFWSFLDENLFFVLIGVFVIFLFLTGVTDVIAKRVVESKKLDIIEKACEKPSYQEACADFIKSAS